MMRLDLRAAALTAALGLPLLAGCSAGAEGSSEEELTLYAMHEVNLETIGPELAPRHADEVVLVNFWATWCGPCMEEMPELIHVAHAWEERGVRTAAVCLDISSGTGMTSVEEIDEFARFVGLDLPVYVYDGGMEELTEHLDLPGPIPFTLVMNGDGEIVDTQLGGASIERFEEMLGKAFDA